MLGTMLNVNVDVVQLNIAKKIAEIKSKLNWFESNSATLDMLVVLFQEIIEDHISLCEFLKTIFDCPPHIKHLTILKMLGFSGKINDLSGLGEYNQQELEALKCMKGSLAAKDEGEDEDGIKFLKIDPFYLQLVFLRRLLTNDEMDGNFSCEKANFNYVRERDEILERMHKILLKYVSQQLKVMILCMKYDEKNKEEIYFLVKRLSLLKHINRMFKEANRELASHINRKLSEKKINEVTRQDCLVEAKIIYLMLNILPRVVLPKSIAVDDEGYPRIYNLIQDLGCLLDCLEEKVDSDCEADLVQDFENLNFGEGSSSHTVHYAVSTQSENKNEHIKKRFFEKMKNGEPVNQAKMLIFLSAIYVHVLDFPLKNEDELNLSNRWPMIVKSVDFSVLSTASKARVNRNLQPYILEFLSENQFDFSLSSYDLCSSQSPVSHPGP